MPNKKRKSYKRTVLKKKQEKNELSNFWKSFVIAGLAFVAVYFVLSGTY